MKTTIDIPDHILRDAIRYSKARTKREAVVTALKEYNRRNRMAGLTHLLGQSNTLISPEELAHSRARGRGRLFKTSSSVHVHAFTASNSSTRTPTTIG